MNQVDQPIVRTARRTAARTAAAVLVGGVAIGLLAACGGEPDAQAPPTASASSDRAAAGATFCPTIDGAQDMPGWLDYSNKYTMPITFVNQSSRDLTLGASEIDCYDFSGNSTPNQFNGATIAVGSQSASYGLLARRTCAYLPDDILGKFQERKARWKTTVSVSGTNQTGPVPTVISCSSFSQSPTMCKSGSSQDMASYTVPIGNGDALRANFKCGQDNDVTVTFKDLY